MGLYWDNGKENGNYYSIIGYILGLYWDSGKENGNYYSIIGYILGLYWDNANYYSIIGYILGFYGGIMEKKMETTIMGCMGGCQNNRPFLDPYCNTAPNI